MRVPQHDHQPCHQPPGNDANFLDEAFLDPKQQLIRLLKQTARSHHPLPPAMPAQVTRLFVDRLLKHRQKPTISAVYRCSSSCRVTQCSPSAGCGYEVDLTVECPLAPLLANPVAHDHLRHVVVRPLMRLIGPTFEHLDVDHLHVEQLNVIIEPRHASHERVAPSPLALSVLRKHFPHFVELSFRVQPHESHLERGGCA